jgi:hypothetical protein
VVTGVLCILEHRVWGEKRKGLERPEMGVELELGIGGTLAFGHQWPFLRLLPSFPNGDTQNDANKCEHSYNGAYDRSYDATSAVVAVIARIY